MAERKLHVENKNGIHARPSASIVETVKKFSSEVTLKTSAGEADAKSIMSILMLKISYGTEITVIANGPDENETLDALDALFKCKFGFED